MPSWFEVGNIWKTLREIDLRPIRAQAEQITTIAVVGGGDSALDWTLDLADKAAGLTLVHRRPEFKAAPASVAKMQALVASGRIRFIEGTADSLLQEGGAFRGIRVKGSDGTLDMLHQQYAWVNVLAQTENLFKPIIVAMFISPVHLQELSMLIQLLQ